MEFVAEESERILSDLTDGEDDECFTSAVVEIPSVVVGYKRRYSDAFAGSTTRQWKSSSRRRIHEQFELLRAVVPEFCSVSSISRRCWWYS